jgi:hypothetical protein
MSGASAAAAWLRLSWQVVSMLSVLTHNGARFSSAYFMAPKVRVTAAKNGENCTAKTANRVRIRKASESRESSALHASCQALLLSSDLTVRSRLDATDMVAGSPSFSVASSLGSMLLLLLSRQRGE